VRPGCSIQCLAARVPTAENDACVPGDESKEPTGPVGVDLCFLRDLHQEAVGSAFDEESITEVITNIAELIAELGPSVDRCLARFPGVDRTLAGWEGSLAAQQCLPDNESRDAFALDFTQLAFIWEALSPGPALTPYKRDYRWLVQVYESLKPPSGNGKLLWHALGAKTIDLIHRNVTVQAVRDDLETLVMDADVINDLLNDPDKKIVEI
jgi:type I restriction enzyme R subunit